MRLRGYTPVLQSHRRRGSNDIQSAAAVKIQRWWRRINFSRVADKMKAVRQQLQARRNQIQQMDQEIAEITKVVSRPSSKQSTPHANSSKKQPGKQSPVVRLKQPSENSVKYVSKPRPVSNENEFVAFKRSESVASVNSTGSDTSKPAFDTSKFASDTSKPAFDTSKPTDKASSILQYLEESETDFPNLSNISGTSLPMEEVARLKTELSEANKNIFTLKAIIERQKGRIQERADEITHDYEHKLAAQKTEFQNLTEKNMEFLQGLLKDKEELIKQQTEATRRVKEVERKCQKEIEELKASFDKELKKQKDIWQTSEKIRRENWLKEKTKEIKEATARGLEPEIARMMSEQRQVMERVKDQQRTELKALREELLQEKDNAIREARNSWLQEADRRVEQERRTYADKISELLNRQEQEMAEMRRRINDEISNERSKANQLKSNSEEYWEKKIAEVEHAWSIKLQNAVAEHKVCCEDTKRKHNVEIIRLREEHSSEMSAWLEIQHKKLQNDLKEKTAAIKAEQVAERDAELKKVIERLCAEQIELKRKFEAETAAQVKAGNDSHQAEMQELYERLSTMKGKLDKAVSIAIQWEEKAKELEHQVEDMNNYLEEKDQTINELQSKAELHEKAIDEHQAKVNQAVKKAEERLEGTISKLVAELKESRLEISNLETQHLQELETLSQREAEGYEAIERRVRQTIAKKDEKIRELTEKLKIATVKAQKLEDLLESQRRELAML